MPITRLISDDGRWTGASNPLYTRIIGAIAPFVQDRTYSPREVQLLINLAANEEAQREATRRPRVPTEAQVGDEPAVDVTD